MARYDKPPFISSDDFEARRSFTYNGKHYAIGEAFPWRNIACSSRKLRDMFNGNYITSSTALAEKKAKRAKKVAANEAEKKKAAKKPVKKVAKPKVVDYDEKTGVITTQSSDDDIKAFVNDQK